MIQIQIEPGEAFDRLSIIEVKKYFALPVVKRILQEQFDRLAESINLSIGYTLAKQIYCSDEYTQLFNANFVVFEGVTKAQKDISFPAQDLDRLNFGRFVARNRLQTKFFGKECAEIKIGYQNFNGENL